MPNWKKVAISGSNVSQFNNDGTYVKMNGSTANGLLTFEAADCAAVESKLTYDGGGNRILYNDGRIVAFSGSAFSGTAPGVSGVTSMVAYSSPRAGFPWSPVSGSGNYTMMGITRYTSHGNGGECASTIAIISQKGASSKNATVELSSIAKQDGCHDAIFSLGVKKDGGTNISTHPTLELLRADGRDETIFLSGSLSIKTSKMSSTSSLGNVLIYDNDTGQIKKSSITPIATAPVESVNGQTGVVTQTQIFAGSGALSGSNSISISGQPVELGGSISQANVLAGSGVFSGSAATPGGASGNVQYNNGSGGFDGESSFTYDASTDRLTIKNPGTGTGGLITNNIEGGGGTLVINDGGHDQNIQFCTYDADALELGDGETNIYGIVYTPDIVTTTATNCPSVVVSTTGQLLAGPVGGAGQTPTLCQVTVAGNTTDQNIELDNSTTNCLSFNGATNCIKATDSNQSGTGRSLVIKGSDNGSTTAGVGGNISICAGNATGVSGAGDGGTILLKAGSSTNQGSDSGYVCVEGYGLVVPNGASSEPGIAFAGDVSMGLWRTNDCVVISRDGQQGTTSHYFGADGYKICDGALAVGNISYSTTTGRIDASNDIVAYSTSDCRLKKYVKPIKNALDKIDKIRGVEFDWKVTNEKMRKEIHSFEGHDVGVLAQEIEEVLPEVVTTRDSGYKAVRYEKIVPLLIQGIKELKDEVEILKSKI